MKNIGFKLVKLYATFAINFYFKKVEVVGKEKIPKNKPILFIANHRNGMIDPILIATRLPFIFHFQVGMKCGFYSTQLPTFYNNSRLLFWYQNWNYLFCSVFFNSLFEKNNALNQTD